MVPAKPPVTGETVLAQDPSEKNGGGFPAFALHLVSRDESVEMC